MWKTMLLGVLGCALIAAPSFAQGWTYQGVNGQQLSVQRNGFGSGYAVSGPQGYQGEITRDRGMQSEDIQQLLRQRR